MTDERAPVVEEVPVRLMAGCTVLFEWSCTPRDLHALVAGRLYVEGMTGITESEMEVKHVGDEIEISLAKPMLRHEARTRFADIAIPSSEVFSELFRKLYAGVDERHESGGMHAAALISEDRIVFQAEDVGRHNVVDKVVGMAALARADVAAHGLLISARVSGEIARKASACAVAWLASRSIPTTLAVDIARTSGMPIIGRAAGKNPFVYR